LLIFGFALASAEVTGDIGSDFLHDLVFVITAWRLQNADIAMPIVLVLKISLC